MIVIRIDVINSRRLDVESMHAYMCIVLIHNIYKDHNNQSRLIPNPTSKKHID